MTVCQHMCQQSHMCLHAGNWNFRPSLIDHSHVFQFMCFSTGLELLLIRQIQIFHGMLFKGQSISYRWTDFPPCTPIATVNCLPLISSNAAKAWVWTHTGWAEGAQDSCTIVCSCETCSRPSAHPKLSHSIQSQDCRQICKYCDLVSSNADLMPSLDDD